LAEHPLRSRPFERILLIKPSALGDVLHTIPVLVKLRARYPAARIDWLLTPENADLIRHHPALSDVVLFPRKDLARLGRSWSATTRLLGLLHAVWRKRYDLAIDLQGQLRSAVLTLASAAAVRIGFDRPRRAARPRAIPGAHGDGWAGAREWSWVTYSHRIRIPNLDVHAVDRYLWLAPMLGLDDAPPDFRVHVPPEADRRVDCLLDGAGLGPGPLAILFPGTVWQTKHWHPDGFARVGRHLLATGRAVVLAGGPADRRRCGLVAAACPGARNLAGQTTLAELAALVRRAAVCVTNDSGPMHLAVALDRPVLSVFGPTDPVRIGPYRRPHAVLQAPLPCAPCYIRRLRHCPHDHACMSAISTEMVIDRLEAILAQGDRAIPA
jgi:lipopolysaccharide heptosyltransferase I